MLTDTDFAHKTFADLISENESSIKNETLVDSISEDASSNFVHNSLEEVLGTPIQCIPSMLSINVWMMYSGKTSNRDSLDDLHLLNLTLPFQLARLMYSSVLCSRCCLVSEILADNTVSLMPAPSVA